MKQEILKCSACGSSYDLEFDPTTKIMQCKTCRNKFILRSVADDADKLMEAIKQNGLDNKEGYERLVDMYNEQVATTGDMVLKLDSAKTYIQKIHDKLDDIHSDSKATLENSIEILERLKELNTPVAADKATEEEFIYDENEYEIDGRELKKYKGKSAYLIIPYGVTSISEEAFSNCCSNLKIIEIPSSVTRIDKGAFFNGSKLTSITVDAKNPKYKSENNCLIEKATKTLILGCKNSIIPEYVTSIGESAFAGCENLISIKIPSGVTSIGDWAFSCCESLTSIKLPSGVTSIGDNAFYSCISLTSIEIPDSVKSIGEKAISYCINLKSLVIPSSVKSIGRFAFVGCTGLKSIELPSSVTSISEGAFDSCESLRSIKIPSSVTSIGNEAFSDCESLKSIDIPSSVTSIGEKAFSLCDGLKTINFGGAKKEWMEINSDKDWEEDGRVINCSDGKIKC